MITHGQRSKNRDVGFPAAATQPGRYLEARPTSQRLKNLGSPTASTLFMTKKKSAKRPTPDSECSVNCLSNAHPSNAGTLNFAPMSAPTSC